MKDKFLTRMYQLIWHYFESTLMIYLSNMYEIKKVPSITRWCSYFNTEMYNFFKYQPLSHYYYIFLCLIYIIYCLAKYLCVFVYVQARKWELANVFFFCFIAATKLLTIKLIKLRLLLNYKQKVSNAKVSITHAACSHIILAQLLLMRLSFSHQMHAMQQQQLTEVPGSLLIYHVVHIFR